MHRATSSQRRNMPLAASQTVYAPHDAFLKRSAKKDWELICLDLVFLARRLAATKNRKNRQSQSRQSQSHQSQTTSCLKNDTISYMAMTQSTTQIPSE